MQTNPETITQKVRRLEAESIALTARVDQVDCMNRTLLVRCERADAWIVRLVGLLEKQYAKDNGG